MAGGVDLGVRPPQRGPHAGRGATRVGLIDDRTRAWTNQIRAYSSERIPSLAPYRE